MAGARGISMPLLSINIYEGATTPTTGRVGDQWMDTSVSPPLFKVCTSVSPLTWTTYATSGSDQDAIQFQDEASNLGASGTVSTVNFTGAGVTASRVSNTVTVNIPGGGVGSSSYYDQAKWSVD